MRKFSCESTSITDLPFDSLDYAASKNAATSPTNHWQRTLAIDEDV